MILLFPGIFINFISSIVPCRPEATIDISTLGNVPIVPPTKVPCGAGSDFDGVSGKISINKEGNATRSAVIKEIKNGKAGFKATVNP